MRMRGVGGVILGTIWMEITIEMFGAIGNNEVGVCGFLDECCGS